MRDVKTPQVRRAEIMAAAMKVFHEKGYLKTRTQDIINEAGISRGLLYYHFKDKEDILYCLIEKYSEPLLQQLKEISQQEDLPVLEKLRLFMDATMISESSLTQENKTLQNTVHLDANRYLLDRFCHKLCRQMTVYFTNILEEGRAQQLFHLERPKETATFLMTAYVFVSNDAKIQSQSEQEMVQYLAAYKRLLARTLEIDENDL
ncbi:TetR/AcrR family transcriptional regulator [Streptococcus massiliensis]|uniref:Transcriptional regulator n=1 Tax=Streptococcus massiliensis TaxID=313439 RepID=A0A380L3V9_9STRE|nr:TetR/AcrR family transcriptional regulator [Streptococcus massiliensis]SUN77211.1 transcriptional regulator [Streptococcus massiliensis]